MQREKKQNAVVKTWLLIWSLGIAGQLCWNIENQWFNTFVYAKIAPNPSIITWMVGVSAAVTTVSTFIFGTLSDRIGSRRHFVAVGYIMWGIFTIVFGLTEFVSKQHVMLAAVLVVIADAIMSFFGSMGNDTGFNAWTNDMMHKKNRGQIGAALATQPVIGTIVGTLLGGALIGKNDNYMLLFLVFGGLVIAIGVISLFTLRDHPSLKPYKVGGFWQQFVKVFNFNQFFKRKELILVNVVVTIFFVGFNIYFTHMGNYLIYNLKFNAADVGVLQGIALIAAMFVALPATILINKQKSPLVSFSAIALNIIGLLLMYFFVHQNVVDPTSALATANIKIVIAIFMIGAGYIVILQATTVWAKQLFPADSKGAFEGIRILFLVAFPMIFSGVISSPLIKATGIPYIDPNGKAGHIPTEIIFIVGAAVTVLCAVPLFFATIHFKKRILVEKEAQNLQNNQPEQE